VKECALFRLAGASYVVAYQNHGITTSRKNGGGTKAEQEVCSTIAASKEYCDMQLQKDHADRTPSNGLSGVVLLKPQITNSS
jgi:hypothetical protein